MILAMGLEHIDWQTWVLILVIALAFLAIAIGFLVNERDSRQQAQMPANQRNHWSFVLRNLVQALHQSRLALGSGPLDQNDPDYAAVQTARGMARAGIMNMGPQPAPPVQPQPGPTPAPVPGNNPPAGNNPATIQITISGDNLEMGVNGNQVFPPPNP